MKTIHSEKLILGTANFAVGYGLGGSDKQMSIAEISRILHTASLLGINRLDTAMAYGDAELTVGQIAPKSFRTITKVSRIEADPGEFGSKLNSMVSKSLLRLRSDQIYGLLIHQPSQLFCREGGEIYDGLLRLKAEGKVEKI